MKKPILIALLATLLMLSRAPSAARADTTRSTVAQSMGILPDVEMGLPAAAIAAASPSAEHAWGTIALVWCESDGPGKATAVHLGEWALHEARWLARKVLRRPLDCPSTLSLARSAERLVLAMGDLSQRQAELVVLERAPGGPFAERAALTFDDSHGASLDADATVIALGTYEERTPVVQMPASSSTPPPTHALHVRLFEPSTLRIIGARVFRGEHLLRPHQVPDAASHALRLLGGRLFIAVPEDDPHVVAVRLPSLATERERAFAVPSALRTPFSSSVALTRRGDELLITIGETFVLSPKLEIVARHRVHVDNPLDPPSHRVLAMAAHGRGIVIHAPEGASATIRVVP